MVKLRRLSEMKAESSNRPSAYQISISEGKATIKFAVNIEKVDVAIDETEKDVVFKYDSYVLITNDRQGLEDDVSENLEQWIEAAKQEEIRKLSEAVRAKRDKLLTETDKEFALDRVNLTIPEKVTASTMLNVIKDIFSELGAVCNGSMARYRQALRDIPQQEGFPYDVKYPIKPNN